MKIIWASYQLSSIVANRWRWERKRSERHLLAAIENSWLEAPIQALTVTAKLIISGLFMYTSIGW